MTALWDFSAQRDPSSLAIDDVQAAATRTGRAYPGSPGLGAQR